MPNLTVRNIPEAAMEKVRTLAAVERRSLNSEILVLLERALSDESSLRPEPQAIPDAGTQSALWEHLCGAWEDERSGAEIAVDIRAHRTAGRPVEL